MKEPKATRECRICLQEKSLAEFHPNGRKRAVENRCKQCVNKQAALRRKLKKTAALKPNSCQCCGKEDTQLCLDHCHETEKFRGWLCAPCNRGIGQLGDDIDGLMRAIKYLKGG